MSAEKPLSEAYMAEVRRFPSNTEKALLAELDRLKARNLKLVEAAEASALLIGIGDGAIERYETLAERFYRETGKMAPGKSVPLAMAMNDDDERRKTWDYWMNAKLAACRGLLRAAIEEDADGK